MLSFAPTIVRSDGLLRVILWWTALVTCVLVWLPLVRGLTQGVAYRWSIAPGTGGRGVGGDDWLLLVLALFPLEVWLFHMGEIRSTANLIGVSLVFWQWFMINRALASARRP